MNQTKSILVVLILLLGYSSCKKTMNTEKKTTYLSNYSAYESEWKKVDALEKRGLGKTIIAKVDTILHQALTEQNTPQIFKALAYRSKYVNQIEEDASTKIIAVFEKQIKDADFPLKQLLHSATAELYFQYYSQNRWRFQQRTQTIHFDKKDIRTWALQDILNATNAHYQASLLPQKELLSLPTENLKSILHATPKNKLNYGGIGLRPSWFDFLAERALSYYTLNEGRVSIPQNTFNPDLYPIFSSAPKYASINYDKKDSSSLELLAIHCFQRLFIAHAKDENLQVLINFDLQRLNYHYQHSQIEEKDSLYIAALKRLSNQHSSSNAQAEVDYKIAQWYFKQGNQYSHSNPSSQWDLKKARELCLKHISKDSYGGQLCKNLLEQIERQEFSFQTEKVYLPGESILFLLQHRNIDSLHFRLVKVPNSIESEEYYGGSLEKEKRLEMLYQLPVVNSWTEVIHNLGDFQSHRSEIQVEGVPRGKYILLASQTKTYQNKHSTVALNPFLVSQLSHISKQAGASGSFMSYILDRKTGEPISNAKVITYTGEYDYSSRRNRYRKFGEYTSNLEGIVRVISNLKHRNIRLEVIHQKDTFISSNAYYGQYRPQKNVKRIQTHFFTDRSIYRPGQTVYFKGIVIEKGKHHNQLQKNHTTSVSLINKNGEKLQSLTFTTNEFGSFQGSFVLPSSGLNGTYRLRGKHGATYFSVEEYKRPTFSVQLDTNSTQAAINTEVSLSGKVKAFSGAAISGAKVTYRITRRTTYPYWNYWRRGASSSNSKEIKNGQLVADSDGNFNFSFFAAADQKTKWKWSPNFLFEVSLEATSPSGETQSLNELIPLGNQGFYLSSNIDQKIQLKELQQLIISAKNVNNQLIKATASITLVKLKTPKSIQRRSYWETLEDPNLRSYPMNSERNELDSFEKEVELLKGRVTCNEPIDLFGNIVPGAYELLIESKDSEEKKISLKQRFILFDENSDKASYPVFSDFEVLKGEGEPGENASFLIGSGLTGLNLLYQIEHDGKVVSEKWINLNKEQRKIDVPIKEEYRGNFSIQLIGIHSNRKVAYEHTINVPYTNKQLKLTLGTYRNKVQPGSKEKWTMTIQGKKGEKVMAELLAGMYDQSLDQFKKTNWSLSLYPANRTYRFWNTDGSFGTNASQQLFRQNTNAAAPYQSLPQLNWFGLSLGSQYGYDRSLALSSNGVFSRDDGVKQGEFLSMAAQETVESDIDFETGISDGLSFRKVSARVKANSDKEATTSTANPIRSDFRETAFFYPQLRTDESGSVSFEFQMPDALTEWKFMALAHTKELKIGQFETSIRTQKELMITPTVPRFFREKDQLQLKATLTNLSEISQAGQVKLRFYNAFTDERINLINKNSPDQAFNLLPGKTQTVFWNINIPEGVKAIKYEIIARSASFSDGEEKVIPVLSNKKLITESLPLTIRGGQEKKFRFDRFLDVSSNTLQHQSYGLEFTANPAWYAIQALPYIAPRNGECSEQVFARLYANSIAEKVANSKPQILEVFKLWKISDSEELTSKLMQNKELKSILIEETPWLQEAKSESEQKKRIAMLFDFNNMKSEKKSTVSKLKQLQSPNGGWPWYQGMRDNRYITQYIINGFGHLKQLGIDYTQDPEVKQMVEKGLDYLDQRVIEDYQRLKENGSDLSKNHLSAIHIHYLYTRSFFQEKDLPKKSDAFQYFLAQAKKHWLAQNIYQKGMIALAVNRFETKSEIPFQITASLKDNALQSESLGMYWKENNGGYSWYSSAIETQSLMIEVFREIAQDQNMVDELSIWLLKQKQTQLWSNSKSTAIACSALLTDNLTLSTQKTDLLISVGQKLIHAKEQEAGTGYLKKVWAKEKIKPRLGEITVKKPSSGIAWGAAYWQYYEDLDQVTTAAVEELSINKTLFKVIIDASGEKMIPIDQSEIQIGDKIRVRLNIQSKRNLEFVHLKDMRASGFEPINVISRYKYQDGLGYYESTKDASTNFFIDRLNKGTYVFEYDLRATVRGTFSNGISTLQCQYAPEFATHSKGRTVHIRD